MPEAPMDLGRHQKALVHHHQTAKCDPELAPLTVVVVVVVVVAAAFAAADVAALVAAAF